jgi:hypothetical protein
MCRYICIHLRALCLESVSTRRVVFRCYRRVWKKITLKSPLLHWGFKNKNGGHRVVQLNSVSASRKYWLQAERVDFTFNIIIRSCPCFKATRILIVDTIYLNRLFLVWCDARYWLSEEESKDIFSSVLLLPLWTVIKYRLDLSNQAFHGTAPLVVRNEYSLPDGHFPPPTLGIHRSPLFVNICQPWH